MRVSVLFIAAIAVAVAQVAYSQIIPTCTCGTPQGEAPCCTYTIGWWKNHHKYQPQNGNQYVPWPQCPGPLANGEDSILFGGLTALEIMDIPGGSDKCFAVAHQYIAALQNECKGACTDANVDQALIDAHAIITTPGLCPGGLTPQGNHTTERAAAIAAAVILENYNSGDDVGPGHCGDEEPEECPVFSCDGGCTLTQGYYKTHSANGKGKNNLPWADLNDGACPHHEDDVLYGVAPNDVTWYDALITAPSGGNACLIAGKQYVAAKLNIDCNGACIPEVFVADALACVKDKLDNYCPGLTPGNGPLTDAEKVVRTTLLTCARTLDAYNNGFLLGPGHCEDDPEEDPESVKGKKPNAEAVEEEALTSSVADGFSIATLVFAILSFMGIVALLFMIRVYTRYKMNGHRI